MAKQKLHWVGRQPFSKRTTAYSRVKLIERISPSGHKKIRTRSYKRGVLCAMCKTENWVRQRTKSVPARVFSLSRAYPSKPARYSACLTTLLRFLPLQMCLILPLLMRACSHAERLYKSHRTIFTSILISSPSFLKKECHACMVYVNEHWDIGN